MPELTPLGRPVGQRPARSYGLVQSIQQATVAVSVCAIALSLPDVTVVVSASTQPVTANTVTLSLPDVTVGTTGTSVPVPYRRAIGQRGITVYGPPSASSTPDPPTNQSVSVSATNIALSLPDVTRFLPEMVLPGGTQTIALSLPDVTASAGPITVQATTNVLALSLPSVGVDQGAGSAPSVPVPYRRAIGQRGVQRFGPPSPSTTPPTTFDQTATIEPCVIALSAVSNDRTATVTLHSGTAVIALSLPTADIPAPSTPGVSATAPELQRKRVVSGRKVFKKPYIGQYGVVDALAPATLTPIVTTPGIALSLPNVTRVPGRSTQAITAVNIALSLPAVSVATGGNSLRPVDTANIVLSLPDVSVAVSGTTVEIAPVVVALSLPDVVANQFVTLTPVAVALSAPAVTVSQAHVRALTTQTIAVSLPDVTVVVQSQTLSAGTQTVALSLPDVTPVSTFTRAAETSVVALSLPDVTRVIGSAVVPITPQVVALRITTPRVIGATTLPPYDLEGDLVSREPEHKLISRMPEKKVRPQA